MATRVSMGQHGRAENGAVSDISYNPQNIFRYAMYHHNTHFTLLRIESQLGDPTQIPCSTGAEANCRTRVSESQ